MKFTWSSFRPLSIRLLVIALTPCKDNTMPGLSSTVTDQSWGNWKKKSSSTFILFRTYARTPGISDSGIKSLERELEVTRQRFQESKTKYQQVSTQLIDKAGMLEMKKVVDFDSHLERIRQGC
jgi:hypothetical protein